jgi:hypothetical protein
MQVTRKRENVDDPKQKLRKSSKSDAFDACVRGVSPRSHSRPTRAARDGGTRGLAPRIVELE